MIRRLLLVSGGSSEPVDPLPSDPTLTQDRGVTQVTGIGQNVTTMSGSGRTFRTEYRVDADFTTLVLGYGTHAQAILTEPWSAKVTLETPAGALIPVTFDGDDTLQLDEGQSVESDPIALTLGEGQHFWLRTFVPPGVLTPIGRNSISCRYMNGDHTTGAWTPVIDVGGEPESPLPVALIGKSRESVICPAMIGDSIAALGIEPQGWWRLGIGNVPGLSYGRNARNFGSQDGREGDTLRAATHVVVQYGANDLGSSPTVAATWANAVSCYAYVDGQNPGIPIWQTTCTPLVTTTDVCTTLAGQTPYSTTRQAWNAFLRDGSPCHPDTKAALAVGASGLRAGQDGHPLAGYIEVAGAVEQGGTSAPTGKWLVGGGSVSWGGDGVHPTTAGMAQMKLPIIDWMSTLTT